MLSLLNRNEVVMINVDDIQAVDFMAGHSFDEQQLQVLMQEMVAYKDAAAPFNPAFMPSEAVPVKKWWLSLQNPFSATVIVKLAVILYSVVPHAAVTERSFSLMKWINAPRRASQTVASIKRITKVRTALENVLEKPR